MARDYDVLDVRPYQLMCLVCRIGAGMADDLGDERLNAILRRVRERPYTPIRLRCNVNTIYQYQNPGHQEDTPEGELFNVKRDLDILQRLALTPGSTMPAIDLFGLLLTAIPTASGICGYGEATAESWKGCPQAASGHYERGQARGIGGIIPPRETEEMARAKKESAEATYRAERLFIRPHHILCMTCFLGGHLDSFAPIEEDNLYEAIVAIQRNPEIPVTFVAGPCMICPPCHMYDPKANLCYLAHGIGLRDEKKDLDTLQLLGLKYGDTLPAREMLALIYERIPSTRLVCAYKDGIERSLIWRICDNPEGSERYRQGRARGMGVVAVD